MASLGALALYDHRAGKNQLLESFVSKAQGDMYNFNAIFKKLKATSQAERGISVEIDD